MNTELVNINFIAGGYLHVNLLAADTIAFTIAQPDSDTLKDVINVIWPLMMLDAAVAELYDGDLHAFNNQILIHLMKVRKFYAKYKDRMSNITTDIFELEIPVNGR